MSDEKDARAYRAACTLLGVSFPKAPDLPWEEQQKVLADWKVNELRRAWRATAAKHHPDKGGKPEDFIAVKEAYDLLLTVEYQRPGSGYSGAEGPQVRAPRPGKVPFGPFEVDEEDVQFAREVMREFERAAAAAASDMVNEGRNSVRDSVKKSAFSFITDLFKPARKSAPRKRKGGRTTSIG